MIDEHKAFNDERRAHERLETKSVIRYRRFDDLANKNMDRSAELCDFSGGGARFVAAEKFSKNEQLILMLEFPGWSADGDEWVRTGENGDVGRLQAIGAVMWCAENKERPGSYEVGVRFTGRVR